MTPDRLARAVRAALFAAVCVLLAATGHILMSGRPVAAWGLGAAFVVTGAAAWATAARERGLAAVTGAAVAVQTVLHSVFSWAQAGASPASGAGMGMGHGGGGAGTSGAHMSSAAMGAASVSSGDMVPLDMAPPDMSPMDMAHLAMGHMPGLGVDLGGGLVGGPGPGGDLSGLPVSSSFGMLAAHLLAALLSGVWLAYGERAAFRLLRALPAGLFRPLGLLLAVVPVGVDRPRFRPVRPGDERAPRRLHLAHSLVSRGPPQAVAVG
ncbi:hypothetical protein [Streptomyces sp. NPDC048659]|uniref:hypothetical protein n=1 Tax=Streptomyces sp. NPDC048659 TaxID=3155489 RepID=UPI00343D6D27